MKRLNFPIFIIFTLLIISLFALTSCNQMYCNHIYSDELASNSTHHYYECNCGVRKDVESHISSGPAGSGKDEVCTVCGYIIDEAAKIKFKTLSVTDDANAYIKVSNDTESFSFIDEIVTVKDAKYIVSLDISGQNTIASKSIPLNVGDNTVYVIEVINDEPTKIFNVTIRRKPLYKVTFDSNGGSAVDSITVEEDTILTMPQTSRAGYTLISWNHNFNSPIRQNTHIVAEWKANTNTPYTVEYYLENLERNGYDLADRLNRTGTTDTIVEAEKKVFNHFSLDEPLSSTSGKIKNDGSLVLKLYYARNNYQISTNNGNAGKVSHIGSHPYQNETKIKLTVDSVYPGYKFDGWYSGEMLLSTNLEYLTFLDKNIEGHFSIRDDIKNFNFISNETSCTITGLKDNAITDLVIPNCVTKIDDKAFKDCTSITTVKFSENSKLTTIGAYAFQNCTSLTSISVPNGATIIQNYAFSGCSALKDISIPNSIINIELHAFTKCINLKLNEYENALYLGNTDNPYLCLIKAKSKSITKTVVHESTRVIYSFAFSECENLKSIEFAYNNQLISTEYHAFYGCTSLTSVAIPESVTYIGTNVFYNCTSLTSVTIGKSVTSIGSNAFRNCSSLTSVTIPSSVTSIGNYAFYGCTSLTSITVNEGNTVYKSIDGNLYSKNGKILIQYAIGKKDTNFTIPGGVTTSIGNSAFRGCSSLTSVTIPSSVTSIGDSAFYDCTSLKSVIFLNPNGWWYSSSSTATSGTSISSSKLLNASTAATYLKSTYDSYYWKRS